MNPNQYSPPGRVKGKIWRRYELRKESRPGASTRPARDALGEYTEGGKKEDPKKRTRQKRKGAKEKSTPGPGKKEKPAKEKKPRPRTRNPKPGPRAKIRTEYFPEVIKIFSV
jgi:hypothetical protein